MNTIGIIAEFNPFHNGHLHLIKKCKELLNADRVIVIMSGDFTQRGTPAVVDKFTRTKMALNCGADVVLELPIYYALSSAEYFARGAIKILDSLNSIDYLCFGSECGDIKPLEAVAKILNDEPEAFKTNLSKELKNGSSFAAAREKAVLSCLDAEKEVFPASILSSPNNILGIEYIRALLSINSNIKPFTVQRVGEAYHSLDINEFSSAGALRKKLTDSPDFNALKSALPQACLDLLSDYDGSFANKDSLSSLMNYKLLLEKENGYTGFLDVSDDLSNKIASNLDNYHGFDDYCGLLKSKDITYSRISRAMSHILLNITTKNMQEYKDDGYTSYARILGMKKDSSALVKKMRSNGSIPVLGNLKEANTLLTTDLQKRLFEETLTASRIYFSVYKNIVLNEYREPLIIL